MNIRFIQSIKGTNATNEDSAGYAGNHLWVIDGATDLFDSERLLGCSVAEVADELSENIAAVCSDNEPLTAVLYKAIQLTAGLVIPRGRSLTTTEYAQAPTFAIALCRELDDALEYLLLGDCFLFVGGEVLTDPRITPFTLKNRERIQAMNDAGAPPTVEERRDIFQQTRLKANSIDGYPIGSLNPSSAYGAVTGYVPLRCQQDILLMTDGFKAFHKVDVSIEETAKTITYRASVDAIYGKQDDATVIQAKVG